MYSKIRAAISRSIHQNFHITVDNVSAESPRIRSHGDVSSNIALVLTKELKKSPMEIAMIIADSMHNCILFDKIEIAKPGFINMFLSAEALQVSISEINALGMNYGNLDIRESVHIEFVSANPTGPLHIGHARGAITGDVVAALLRKSGRTVATEYYINDAGNQIIALSRSCYIRYLEALGCKISVFPEGLYPGDYLIPIGKKLLEKYGDSLRNLEERAALQKIQKFCVNEMMYIIRADLQLMNVQFNNFQSEKALQDEGRIEHVIDILKQQNLIYTGKLEKPKVIDDENWQEKEILLFKSTEFGDDMDRALTKGDGAWTYFASDVAYHHKKLSQNHDRLILALGADHVGYKKRIESLVYSLSDNKKHIDIKLYNLVHLLENGQQVKMSKRKGNFVTVRDVINAVGVNNMRFTMLTRDMNTELDFDFIKIKEMSNQNPVFYVQYAHARACSIMRKAENLSFMNEVNLSLISHEESIIKKMIEWPIVVEKSANELSPHLICKYLQELAAEFHSLWNMGNDDSNRRFIMEDNINLTQARLEVVKAFLNVMRSGLAVLNVEPIHEMR